MTLSIPFQQQTDRLRQLAALYSPAKRHQQFMGVFIALSLLLTDLYLLGSYSISNGVSWFRLGTLCLLAVAFADLCSGVVHWACDTWGSIKLPIIGQNILRPFRQHHIAPQKMCQHDFIETNGDNFSVCLPTFMALTYVLYYIPPQSNIQIYWALLVFLFYVMFTNQIHKLSHQHDNSALVRLLQNLWLILPAKHHRIHHSLNHQSHYCITTGWMNSILELFDFWKNLEKLITRVTGQVPRKEDMIFRKKD